MPGWKWFEDVSPLAGTALCEVGHIGMVISGRTMRQGVSRVEMKAGDLFYIPPVAHDSWMIGDEPYVSLHFLGAKHYTK